MLFQGRVAARSGNPGLSYTTALRLKQKARGGDRRSLSPQRAGNFFHARLSTLDSRHSTLDSQLSTLWTLVSGLSTSPPPISACPEGAKPDSPGQRPGKTDQANIPKGPTDRHRTPPARFFWCDGVGVMAGLFWLRPVGPFCGADAVPYPGRCPGLSGLAPSGQAEIGGGEVESPETRVQRVES